MLILAIILLLISIILAYILMMFLEMNNKPSIIAVLLFIFTMFGTATFMEAIYREYSPPAAIDVYRNKTTLLITYKDSVAVDSTVVYKK